MGWRWRLKPQDGMGCGFDCPQQPYFLLEPGFEQPQDPAVLQRIQEFNATRTPNVLYALITALVGIVCIIIGRVVGSISEVDGRFVILGIFLALGFILIFGSNVVEQQQLNAYLERLREVAARPSAGTWEVQDEPRCDHDCSCYNGYRNFCCRRAIYVQYNGAVNAAAYPAPVAQLPNTMNLSSQAPPPYGQAYVPTAAPAPAQLSAFPPTSAGKWQQ